jgi:hypothetical protein
VHDIGLAAWFDGSLMVRHGLNGAANQVQDRTGLPSRGLPGPHRATAVPAAGAAARPLPTDRRRLQSQYAG